MHMKISKSTLISHHVWVIHESKYVTKHLKCNNSSSLMEDAWLGMARWAQGYIPYLLFFTLYHYIIITLKNKIAGVCDTPAYTPGVTPENAITLERRFWFYWLADHWAAGKQIVTFSVSSVISWRGKHLKLWPYQNWFLGRDQATYSWLHVWC